MTFAPKHLFVPVDADVTADRDLANQLVDAAADLASAFDAKITLAHVALPVVTSPVPPVDSFGEAYRAMADVLEARNASASRTLSELKDRVAGRGRPVEVVLVTKAGSVPELLVEAAGEAKADLIVMATHARKGIKRIVLGSVAERTAHISGLPVMLLPPEALSLSPSPRIESAMSKNTVEHFMTRHPHSVRAGESVAVAEELMKKVNCHLLPVLDGGRLVGVVSDRDLRLVKKGEGKNVKLEDVCVEEPQSVDIDTSVSTAAAMMAEHRISSVLVMENGKLAGIFTSDDRDEKLERRWLRRGLSHLLMGSVAEQVMRKARTPVLVVKEADLRE